MEKKIVIGCLITVFVIMLLPATSVAESSTIEERIPFQQQPIIDVKDDPPAEPTFILRLLLWLRNLIAAGILVVILTSILGLGNQTGV